MSEVPIKPRPFPALTDEDYDAINSVIHSAVIAKRPEAGYLVGVVSAMMFAEGLVPTRQQLEESARCITIPAAQELAKRFISERSGASWPAVVQANDRKRASGASGKSAAESPNAPTRRKPAGNAEARG